MDSRILRLFDEYRHTTMPRRIFLERLAALVGGTKAALAMLPGLEGGKEPTDLVAADDPRIESSKVAFRGASGEVVAYLAKPAAAGGKQPGVIVIHENRGLNRHIEDVTRRLAVAGFLSLAPDALSRHGGTPADADRARELIGGLDAATTLADFVAAIGYLEGRPEGNGKVGCVGFCWGGAMSNRLATASEKLDAAVVYYGRAPELPDVPKIAAPLLLHMAGLDERVNAGLAAYEAALKAHAKRYTLHVYEGAQHAFHNDTSPARYNEAAAKLS